MRALGSAEQVGAASVVGWTSEGETHGAEAAELQSSAEPRPHAGGREMRSGEIWRAVSRRATALAWDSAVAVGR